MAKRKMSKSSGGPRKTHGPKRKLFHEWDRSMRVYLGQAGVLDKYHNQTSFRLAVLARGGKNRPEEAWQKEWTSFYNLPRAEQKAYFKALGAK